MNILKSRDHETHRHGTPESITKAMKEFQEHEPRIVCWLSSYKTNLHNHQKVQNRLAC
jgi:hypothetical protein